MFIQEFLNKGYIYFIIPLVALFLSLLNEKKNSLITVLMILILLISKNGSDYHNYEKLYLMVKEGVPLNLIHGEIGYKLLMKFAIIKKVKYYYFSTGILIITTLIFNKYLKKIQYSNYSLFLWNSIYLIYIISAQRQYISMTILLISLTFKKNRNKIFVNGIGMLFHISSILPLTYFLLLKKIKWTRIKLIIGVLLSFFIRILIPIFLNKLLFLISRLGSIGYLKNQSTLFSLSFISRIIPLIIILYYFDEIKQNKKMQEFFEIYYYSVLTYIMIPYLTVASRLGNVGKFLEIILITYLIFDKKNRNKMVKFLFFSLYGLIILCYQLINQGGYFPYKNDFLTKNLNVIFLMVYIYVLVRVLYLVYIKLTNKKINIVIKDSIKTEGD